ncbi:MAG TPA: hypothetical protein VIY47_16615 [Ignavibacteriaceae bacterium]
MTSKEDFFPVKDFFVNKTFPESIFMGLPKGFVGILSSDNLLEESSQIAFQEGLLAAKDGKKVLYIHSRHPLSVLERKTEVFLSSYLEKNPDCCYQSSDLPDLLKNFQVVDLYGKFSDILDENYREWMISSWKEFDVIVVDSLDRIHHVDVSRMEFATEVYTALCQVAKKTDAAVLVVHLSQNLPDENGVSAYDSMEVVCSNLLTLDEGVSISTPSSIKKWRKSESSIFPSLLLEFWYGFGDVDACRYLILNNTFYPIGMDDQDIPEYLKNLIKEPSDL